MTKIPPASLDFNYHRFDQQIAFMNAPLLSESISPQLSSRSTTSPQTNPKPSPH